MYQLNNEPTLHCNKQISIEFNSQLIVMYPGVKPPPEVDTDALESAFTECSNVLYIENYTCSTKLDYANERRSRNAEASYSF